MQVIIDIDNNIFPFQIVHKTVHIVQNKMSLSNRATSKGGKGAKADKSHKSDKTDSGKIYK